MKEKNVSQRGKEDQFSSCRFALMATKLSLSHLSENEKGNEEKA
jgi:hypothetical protein